MNEEEDQPFHVVAFQLLVSLALFTVLSWIGGNLILEILGIPQHFPLIKSFYSGIVILIIRFIIFY